MSCKEHPSYGGRRSPRTDCEGCWSHYNSLKGKSDAGNAEEEVKTKDKVENKTEAKTVCKKETRAEAITKQEPVSQPVVENQPIKLPKELTKEVEDAIAILVKETLAKKLLEAKGFISNALNIEYEHLFVSDDHYSITLGKKLTEEEGWEYVKHSYPLEKYGVISRDHTVFKRVKKVGNIPMPNFDDEKVLKKYGARNKKEK